MTALDVNPAGWCDGHQLAVRGTAPIPSPVEPTSPPAEPLLKSALRSRARKGRVGTLLCALVLLGGIPALFTVLCNAAGQELSHPPARHAPPPPNHVRIVGASWPR